MLLTTLIALIVWILGVAFVAIYEILTILAMGIPSYTYDETGKIIGKSYKSIVEFLFTGGFNENRILWILLIFILIAIVLIGIFGVIKVIIISFKGEDNNGDQTTPKIVAQRIVKGLALTLAVPVLILFLNFVMSNFTQLIYNTVSSGQDIGTRVTHIIFGFSSNHGDWKWQLQTENIFEVGKGVDLVKFRDALFYASNGDRWDIVSEFFGTSKTLFNFIPLFFGVEAGAFKQVFNCSWFLLFVVLLILLIGCGKGILACGKKLVDTVLLEVTFPFATSVYPIDNGKRTMAQIQAILTKLLGATILIFAFNMYFIIINLVSQIPVNIKIGGGHTDPATLQDCMEYMIYVLFPSGNAVKDCPNMYQAGVLGLAYVVIITMGAVTVQTAPELLGHLISDQSASMSASDNNAIEGTVKSAVRTAGALGLGALTVSYIGGKMGVVGAEMGASATVGGVGLVANGIGHKVQSYNAKQFAKNIQGVTDKKLLKQIGKNAKHDTKFGSVTKGIGKFGLGAGSNFVNKGGMGTSFGSGIKGIFGAGASMYNSHNKNKKDK